MRGLMIKINYLLSIALLLWMPTLASAEITVESAWVRMPPPISDTAAAYLIVNNSGDADVKILSVETDVAGKPEFHSIIFLEGAVLMQKMGAAIVPAHGHLKLSPGGNHLMLKDLKRKLNAGDHIILKLNTSDGQSIEVHAEVRGMRKMQ
jgi:copper(I)-binding protein